MKLTKCPNGHFYDAEKYQQCPHCAGGVSGTGTSDGPTDAFVSPGGYQGNAGGADIPEEAGRPCLT